MDKNTEELVAGQRKEVAMATSPSIIAANVAAWRSRRRVAAQKTTAAVAAVRQGIALPSNTREALRLLPVRHLKK